MADPILTKELYKDLQIDRGYPLRIEVAGYAIQAESQAIVNGDGGVGVPSFAHLFAPRPVEGMVPASILQQFVVTLDYGRRTVSLARPGNRPIDGIAVPFTLNPKSGLVTMAAVIAGRSCPIVIDAGSGYSWMRGSVVKQWLASHPGWKRADGAVGPSNANMVDFEFEKQGVVARIPEVHLGSLRLTDVGVLGTAAVLGQFLDSVVGDLFWDNWQKGASEPVIGWIGGNVLRHFRLTIDYPNRMSYWKKQSNPTLRDLDQVGLTLVRRDDRYFIGGLVRGVDENQIIPADMQIGDELVAVNDFVARGAGKDAILAALHGKPGERRRLVIERSGQQYEVDTVVRAFN